MSQTFQVQQGESSPLEEFGLSFTKAYLIRYLPLTNDSIIVKVSSPVHTKEYEVSMKLGIGTKKAIITSGWNHVVKRYRLHEKEIVAFSFWECKTGGLHVLVKMDSCKNGTGINSEEEEDEGDYISEEDDYISEEDDYVSEEDDYVSEEDDYIPDDDDDDETRRLTVRGPGYRGKESFDEQCIFGNEVEMTFNQMMKLKTHVDKIPRAAVKEYVCTLSKNNIVPGEGNMEFTREYTKAFLLKFMLANCMKRAVPITEEVIPVVVNGTDSNLDKYCTMRFGLSGMAKISVGWTKVVKQRKKLVKPICSSHYVHHVRLLQIERMDGITCVDCHQQVGYCGRRSNMRSDSFEVVMMQGFEDGIRSLVRVYDIQVGGEVSFKYAEENDIFDVTVYHHVDSGKEKKRLASDPVVNDVDPHIRIALHKAVFSNINALTEQ
ncbi:hypothetical protein ACQ4PT_034364 [Festuca glaucescens]